jgi:hypothetical protein
MGAKNPPAQISARYGHSGPQQKKIRAAEVPFGGVNRLNIHFYSPCRQVNRLSR